MRPTGRTRRDFLKAAGAGLAAAKLPGCVTSLVESPERSERPEPREKPNFIVNGGAQ